MPSKLILFDLKSSPLQKHTQNLFRSARNNNACLDVTLRVCVKFICENCKGIGVKFHNLIF